MEQSLEQMAAVAREYCALIEQSSSDVQRDAWLERMVVLLPRLHAAVIGLRGAHGKNLAPLSVDYEARFELFARLRGLLGEDDSYWLEYDDEFDVHSLSGSLADDLTDIYFDLKRGLMLLKAHPELPDAAAWDWRASFQLHWGQHLIDAERHLYTLEACHRFNHQQNVC